MHASSRLLPLLRSPFQGELLAWLFLHPGDEYSATDLARRFGVSQPTASREADRLTEAGLIEERRTGNLRLLRAKIDTVVARPLTDLLAVTYGPLPVISELLSRVPDVDEAHIYGSWAARYRGEAGAIPRDIDVLVVGDADEDDLYDAARTAEQRLGREVNIHRVTPETWRQSGGDPFLESVRSRPTVPLDLAEERT
ncbi:MarR family transcriptional regulator [Planosporangium mesophilum]|nr:MarR family transcriptional regulator [Planosporangium mesophilum]